MGHELDNGSETKSGEGKDGELESLINLQHQVRWGGLGGCETPQSRADYDKERLTGIIPGSVDGVIAPPPEFFKRKGKD